MTEQEIDDLILECERWEVNRQGAEKRRVMSGKRPLIMGTLPRVIDALRQYKRVLKGRADDR